MNSPRSSRPEAETSRRAAWERLVAASPPDWVLRHCLCVEALAAAMAARADAVGLEVDAASVARGALLHDIGRSVTQGLDHAYRGADMLREPPAWPETVVRIIETHTGAGVEAEEARQAGLPDRDYMPRSLEERIVAHADNLHSGDKRVSLEQVVAKYERRGLDSAARRIVALHDDLERRLACDLEAVRPPSAAPP